MGAFQNSPLIGSQLCHLQFWYVTVMVILSTLSHLVMNVLTLQLMQFLPLSNDHYHIYFNAVWLISWTLEVKTKLLSNQKHYNAHNDNANIQL